MTFQILEHVEKLTPAKQKGRYICPVCQGNNLTIGKEGAYQCWSGCLNEDIREVIAPWSEKHRERSNRITPHKPKPKAPTPTPLPKEINLVKLPSPATDSPQPQKRLDPKRGEVEETTYYYAPDKWKIRLQWKDPNKPKGYDKSFWLWHRDVDGNAVAKAGEGIRLPYRIDEVIEIANASGANAVMGGEGESVVEAYRRLGLGCVTLSGFSKAELDLMALILKEAGLTMIYHPDNDTTGLAKAAQVQDACDRAGVPCLVLDPTDIWNDVSNKGDADDWISWGVSQGMDLSNFIEQLERAYHGAAAKGIEPEPEDRKASDAEGGDDAKGSEHTSFDLSDWVNPESPVAGTVESLTLNTLFEGGNGKAVTIDDCFYEDTGRGFWSKRPDNIILKQVAHKIQKAFTLKRSKEKITRIFPFGTDTKLKSCFMFCRKALDVGELPANRHLRAFSNCTVDLRTGESIPHDRNHFLTTSIAADYHPDQPCPDVFLRFINSAYGLEQLDAIRAYTSMLLDPTAPYGFFIHLMGPSGSGKGTLLRLWGEMFSLEHFRSGDFGNLATPEARHQYLTGTALYVIPDCGGYLQGLKAFYELVDNGPMAGRALFSSHGYQKRWDTRFVAASVDHLQIENSGDGWDRRCRPLITKARRGIEDPDLGTKLAEVRGQIISWALAMPREERDRILLCPSSNEQILQHKLDAAVQGDPLRAFIDLCFRPTTDTAPIYTHQLHSWFKVFAEAHGYNGWGMSKLGSHLKTIIPSHFSPRRRATAEEDPTRGMVSSHWFNLKPLPGVFIDVSDVGEGSQEPIWKCIKAECREGGLTAFQDFHRHGSHGIPVESAKLTDFTKVADPSKILVEQCLQENGSGGSGGSQGGVSNQEEIQIEIKIDDAKSLTTQSPPTPSPIPDLYDLPDPWLETTDIALPSVDQMPELIVDPPGVFEPEVPDPPLEVIAPIPTGLAPSEVAAFILRCSLWVEIVERLDNVATKVGKTRVVVFNAALKLLDKENRQHLVKLLSEHIQQYPHDPWAYTWLPESCKKLRQKALDIVNKVSVEVEDDSILLE